MTDDVAALAESIGRVESALASLRTELETAAAGGGDGDGAEAVPPAELLRIADEVAIPAMEATLLANERTLAATRAAVRAAREEGSQTREGDPGSPAGSRADDDAERTSGGDDGPTPVEVDVGGGPDEAGGPARSRENLEPAITRVEDALDDLRAALRESESPVPDPARDALGEARSLREEVDRAVADATDRADRARRTRIPVETEPSGEDGGESSEEEAAAEAPGTVDGDSTTGGEGEPDGADAAGEDAGDEPAVDVEAELETIKREYARQRENLPEWATDDAADAGGDATDGGSDAEGDATADEADTEGNATADEADTGADASGEADPDGRATGGTDAAEGDPTGADGDRGSGTDDGNDR